MAAAAAYIRRTLIDAGYTVNIQSFTSRGVTVNNLEAVLPGKAHATATKTPISIGVSDRGTNSAPLMLLPLSALECGYRSR